MKGKKFKAKKFRVAVEGATTDGRKISRVWIEQMAKNYDPKKYGARINLEHIKGILPDSPFRAYGDVLSLDTQEIDDNGTKKLALVAELEPTEDLVALNQKRQKVYTSIEVHPSFADTGEAYLMGLAVTDDPASLGTEMLEFSASAKNSPLATRKTQPECLFSAAEEVEMAFEEQSDEPALFDKVKGMFKRHQGETSGQIDEFKKDLENTMGLFVTELQSATDALADLKQKHGDLAEKHSALQTDYDALKAQLDKTPSTQFSRPPAAGNEQDAPVTDC